MILMSSPEYESRLEYQFKKSQDDRLDTPTDITTENNSVYFGAVEGATSYSVYLDGKEFDTFELSESNKSNWILNELISIDDNEETVFDESFICNEITYSTIKIYGRNKSQSGKFCIYFDNTLVYEETEQEESLWKEQSYRYISITNLSSSEVRYWLNENAVKHAEQLTIDLSDSDNWNEVSDGSHLLQLVARAENIKSSFLSSAVNFGKNVDFIKGVIYGPYVVTRVIDGDTVIANINGAETKIRMIGVNTPESVSSNPSKNCEEGRIASAYTKEHLTDENIYIEFDTDQTDKFNRYLCYIYTDSQGVTMYNNELIEIGYGEAKYYSPNGAHKLKLEATQAEARSNQVGFWEYGFFPTKLVPPVVTISENIITWEYNKYTGSYNIKDNGNVVYNYLQESTTGNSFDLSTLELSSGNHRINVVSVPLDGTHEMSNNSNNINYIV